MHMHMDMDMNMDMQHVPVATKLWNNHGCNNGLQFSSHPLFSAFLLLAPVEVYATENDASTVRALPTPSAVDSGAVTGCRGAARFGFCGTLYPSQPL